VILLGIAATPDVAIGGDNRKVPDHARGSTITPGANLLEPICKI
jgi:hypothetical protein